MFVTIIIYNCIFIYIYYRSMQEPQNPVPPPPQRQQQSQSRQLFFIIFIYLVITLSTRFDTSSSTEFKAKIKDMLKLQTTTGREVFSYLTPIRYEGVWHSLGKSQHSKSGGGFLSEKQGKILFTIKSAARSYDQINQTNYYMELSFYNGYYIDKGIDNFLIQYNQSQWNNNWKIVTNEGKQPTYTLIIKTEPDHPQQIIKHNFLKFLQMFASEDSGNITNMQFNFTTSPEEQLSFTIKFETQKLDLNENSQKTDLYIEEGYSIAIQIQKEQSTMVATIIYAVVLSVIAFAEFSAMIDVFKQISIGVHSPEDYSLITMLICMMWDAIFCFLSFFKAFSNQQQTLVLFILPAFLFCLLFTNLEIRLMLLNFQARYNDANIRQTLCKFNCLSYGCLILIYPILKFTSFNWILFIGISLLLVPQIILNGIRSRRPVVTDSYYQRFILIRFLFVFYIKGFPLNVYDMEPDFLLCTVIAILVIFQVKYQLSKYSLLFIQKYYGPKTVVPSFFLPPVFNYKYQGEQINIQQAGSGTMQQCSICLTYLANEVQNQLGFQPGFKIMKTPCNHKYHAICLISWMRVKMQCPQCRKKLPPYQ